MYGHSRGKPIPRPLCPPSSIKPWQARLHPGASGLCFSRQKFYTSLKYTSLKFSEGFQDLRCKRPKGWGVFEKKSPSINQRSGHVRKRVFYVSCYCSTSTRILPDAFQGLNLAVRGQAVNFNLIT